MLPHAVTSAEMGGVVVWQWVRHRPLSLAVAQGLKHWLSLLAVACGSEHRILLWLAEDVFVGMIFVEGASLAGVVAV